MTQPHDTHAEWELAVSCLAEQAKAGRKLSPSEMLSRVDHLRPVGEIAGEIVARIAKRQGANE